MNIRKRSGMCGSPSNEKNLGYQRGEDKENEFDDNDLVATETFQLRMRGMEHSTYTCPMWSMKMGGYIVIGTHLLCKGGVI